MERSRWSVSIVVHVWLPVLLLVLLMPSGMAANKRNKKKKAEAKKEEVKKEEPKVDKKEEARRKKEEEAQRKADEEARKKEEEADRKRREADEKALLAELEGGTEDVSVKKTWIDQELEFAGKLVQVRAYDNIADAVIARVRSGAGFDNKPLSEPEEMYLRGQQAKIKMNLAFQEKEADRKVKLAEEAINELKEIVGKLPKGVMQREATIDLIEGYVRLGESFTRELMAARARGEGGESAKAEGYFTQMEVLGKPLRETILDRFLEVMDKVQAANEEGRNEVFLKLQKVASVVFMRQVRLQHAMERGYASWCYLSPRGSDGRKEVVKNAVVQIEDSYNDYDFYFPTDKQLYFHWILVLAALDDPLTAKEKDGSPSPRTDPAEGEEQKYDPFLFHWPSDRAKALFRRNFAEKQKGVKVTDDFKIRGLYNYADALGRFAVGAYKQAEKAQGADKDKWQAHADGLYQSAMEAMDDLVGGRPTLVKLEGREGINLQTRMTTRLRVRSPFFVSMARIAKSKGDEEAVRKMLGKAREEASLVVAEGGAKGWKYHGQERMKEVGLIAKTMGVEMGEDINGIMARTEEIMREIRVTGDEGKRNSLLRKCNQLFIQALATAREYESKNQRAGFLVNIYNRMGINALKLEDFNYAYIVLFELVQEFNPKDYPRDQFESIDDLYKRSLNNLRYGAGKLRKSRDNDLNRKLYVDALRLILDRSEDASSGAGRMMKIVLVDELRGLGFFVESLDEIDSIEPDYIHYRTSMLIGAGICQKLLSSAQKKLDKLPDPDAARAEGAPPLPEGKALEALKARRAELTAEMKRWSDRAVGYAERFISEYGKRKPLSAEEKEKDKERAKAYEQEDKNLPNAYMIPINIALTEKKYARMAELVDGLEVKLGPIAAIKQEEKDKFVAVGYYLKLVSVLRSKDPAKAPVEEVSQSLGQAKEVLMLLDGKDKERDRANRAFLMMGAAWNNLGGRYEVMMAEEKDAAKKEELKKAFDQCRLNAAEYFVRAEGAVYEQLNLGLMIGKIYSTQQMHDKAEAVYRVAMNHWADSLFTTGYLYQGQGEKKKSLDDLKRADLPAEVSAAAATLGLDKAVGGISTDEELVKALNAFVRGNKYAENKEAMDKVLAARAKGLGSATKGPAAELAASIRQATALASREAIDKSRELRQRLNRVVVEAIYQDILRVSKLMPVIPEKKVFDKQLAGIGTLYPANPNGRKKAELVKALHDPALVRSSSGKQTVADYRTGLDQRLKNAQTGEKKKKYGRWLKLFDPGLKTRVYGIDVKGKIEKRSYGFAREQIAGIFEWDKEELPMSDAQVKVVPTAGFLKQLDEALTFKQNLNVAQKRYVGALMALGKFGTALEYLVDLVKIYPNNRELKVRLSRAESFKGAKAAEEKKYGQEEANLFMRARMRALEVYKPIRKKPGTELWWQARMFLFENDVNEITTRHAAGAAEVDFETKWRKWHREENKFVEWPIKTESSLEKQASKLINEITRLLTQPPLGLEVSEEQKKTLKGLVGKVTQLGYKAEKYKAPEEKKDKAPEKGGTPDQAPAEEPTKAEEAEAE